MKKILVIDDELDILNMVSLRLNASGFEVVTANSGEEGLAKVEQELPDLIVLDLMMPGIKGNEVATRLKHNTKTEHIPIIFLSALIHPKDITLQETPVDRRIMLSKLGGFSVLANKIKELLA